MRPTNAMSLHTGKRAAQSLSSSHGPEHVKVSSLSSTQTDVAQSFAIAKAACDPDPWRERREMVHPKQFSELDSDPEGLDLVALAAAGLAEAVR